MTPSIIVLLPYFGVWPDWIELFFESVRRNEDVDFLVVTDCDTGVVDAPNITFRETTFAAYVRATRDVLGIDFDPPDAYKLCDLRPLFGALHEDDFSQYDFYGWCDTDLLFGRIRDFYTDETLARYDVLSTHEHRISGHFALFRNTRRNRDMYRRIYRWRDALARPEFVGIDEHGITNAYLMTPVDKANEKFGWSLDNVASRSWATWRRRRLYLREQYTTPFVPRPWLDGSLDSAQPEEWYYRDGTITNSRDGDRPFIYLHFMNFKSSRWRHDGTAAPWEGREDVIRARPEDMREGIVIDPAGIRPEALGSS